MAKDHSAETLELQQKAPQERRGLFLRFPPSQLLLKGSKEEYTIMSKHVTDVQQGIQQTVVFIAALLVWGFFYSIITDHKQGLSSPQEFILAGKGAKIQAC